MTSETAGWDHADELDTGGEVLQSWVIESLKTAAINVMPGCDATCARCKALEAQLTKVRENLECVGQGDTTGKDVAQLSYDVMIEDAASQTAITYLRDDLNAAQARIAELGVQLKSRSMELASASQTFHSYERSWNDEIARRMRIEKQRDAAQAQVAGMLAKVAEAEANIYIDDDLEAMLCHADRALGAIRDAGAPQPVEEGKK